MENLHVSTEKKEDTRAYIETDRLGRIVCVNSVLLELLSKTDAELTGQYLNTILMPISGNTRAFHYVWHGIRKGNVHESNFVFLSKDKKEMILKFEIQTDTNVEGDVNRIIMVSEDTSTIPRQKNSLDKTRELTQNKEEIVGMMSSLKSNQNDMLNRMQQSRNSQKELLSNMQNILSSTLKFSSF